MESSSSSYESSKRAKAPASITQAVSCLVDGCNSDLSQCRDYHRRHKVCEVHSKTSKVTIGGREQRFCQQCSRFHSLVEFDEGKRSCRKRLDGHNRRRRKPQADSVSRNSGMFLSSQPGSRIFSFNNPQILPSAGVSSAWAGTVKAENDVVLFQSHPTINYMDRHNSYSAHQFQFLQGSHQVLPEPSVRQPLLNPDTNSSGQNLFPNVLNRVGNSGRAHSLLSSAAPTETRKIGSSHMVQPADPIPQGHSLFHNQHFGSVGQYSFQQETESKATVSGLDSSHGSNRTTTLHFEGMFHNGSDCSSANEDHQTHTFRWE